MPQNPNEAKVVRVTNIFDFDYTHAYGGVPYQLRAGETLLFPWAIGDHLATHLARQAIIRKAPMRDNNAKDGRGGESERSDRPLWDDTAIDAIKAMIVKEAYVEERAAPMTEAERMKQKFDDLNKSFPEVAKLTEELAAQGLTPGDESEPATATTVDGSSYKDKAEVIAALEAKKIPFNPRATKASLEKLLQ